MPNQLLTHEGLELNVHETELLLTIHFRGVSEARDPSPFLWPVLSGASEKSVVLRKELALDFRKLERMNSATVGVIVRMFAEARSSTARIRVVYDSKQRWQRLCFTTLIAYDTPGHRIHLAPM